MLFPHNSLWNDSTHYFLLDEAFKTEVSVIAHTPSGKVCYIHKEIDKDGIRLFDYNWHSALHCKDSNEQLILNIERQGLGIIKGVIFAPDERIVVAELVETPIPMQPIRFFLRISIYSEDGILLAQEILSDPPEQSDLYFYNVLGETVTRNIDSSLAIADTPTLQESAPLFMQWSHNTLNILTYTYGIKFYRLSDTLENIWDVQVMPAYPWLWLKPLQVDSSFTITPDGETLIAFEISEDDHLILEQHFNRKIDKEHLLTDILVSIYSPTGTYARSFLLGKPELAEQLTEMYADNIDIWLFGNVRHKKISGATEWDVLQARYTLDKGQELDYNLINIEEGDLVRDVEKTPNGNFIVAGTFGFKQAESNSQVTNGKGFIAEITSDGSIIKQTEMVGPRNNVIHNIIVLDNNRVMFSNSHNGPITHTCDNNAELCFNQAAIGITEIKQLP